MTTFVSIGGHRNAVWQAHSNHKPEACPGCAATQTLQFIGTAYDYEPGLRAKLYQCAWCGAWLDCIYPHPRTESTERQRPFQKTKPGSIIL